MRASRFLLLVGIITLFSIFYIYQQCVIAFRPLEKRVQQLTSLDSGYEKKGNAILAENAITKYNTINGEFSSDNTNLQVAKK